jgi:enamine deaminase RidA (YjgF/YER057c/UK114 family)
LTAATRSTPSLLRSTISTAAPSARRLPSWREGDADELQKSITIVRGRRNPMPKLFTTIVPPSLKAVSEAFQFAPAVRIGDQILISGIVGVDAEGRLPPDFRSQAENVFTTLEAILNEAGATLDDVASLHSYHVGDLHSQLRELVDIKAKRIRPPHPAWTGVGVTQLGVPGALLEISAVVVARD